MSFGFPKHVDSIRRAIKNAQHCRDGAITFFAAAANEGHNSPEMFPANLGDPVIAIRGTNSDGAFEPRFSPPSSTGFEFGALGKDVFSDWAGQSLRKSMSGCSVATAIAAGLAAMLLGYATDKHDRFNEKELRLMRTWRGLVELFKNIDPQPPRQDGRYYMAPFILFGMSEEVRIARMKAAINRHPELL